ncbi:O-antigen ligase family protein [Paenibacillus harenae]|uniref:O-antigen ligase n=1 Tax=Paenibacillus harenae TaxID=306543 RepID=A0ABT9U6G0_PAEHA|nr:O-antigen ligase family protein [Paenibacillus harenae]MDQ0115222.1 O-antigen ligase [Paenibacillus harenae]
MSARKKSTNGATSLYTTNFSFWNGFVVAGIALFLLISPYYRALFNGYSYSFENAIYKALFFGLTLLLLTAVYLVKRWKLDSYRDILAIIALLPPLIYWLSSFNAVSGYYANFMIFVIVFYTALFIAGMYFADSVRARKLIEYSLMLTSYIIVLSGLLNLFGQTYYPDALWLAHDGYRLTAVFQYSNTYAGFLVALFLASLYYASHCIRWQARLAHSLMLVPIWISFMLTYSRGAIVIIPVMVLAILPFLRFTRQITYILYMGISVLVAMAVLGPITTKADAIALLVQPTTDKQADPISLFNLLPLQSWGLLIAASAVVAGIILLIEAKAYRWIEAKTTKFASHKWSFVAVPAIIVILCVLAAGALLGSGAIRSLLPDKIAERFENLNFQQHSVQERFTFYKDGLRLSEDYPLLGGGGGAWQSLFEQYQNNPYWSRQAHSFFVQVLVESGWIGLVALLLLIGGAYWTYIRSYIRHPERRGSHLVFFIFSLALLMHSAIDFDMSFLFISSIVFLSLGCMIAPFSSTLKIPRLQNRKLPMWSKYVYPAVIGLTAIVLLVITIQNNSANQLYNQTMRQASQQGAKVGDVLPMVDKAIKRSPDQTTFSLTKASWLKQVYNSNKNDEVFTQALLTLEQAKKHDPNNRSIIAMQLEFYQLNNQLSTSIELLEEGMNKFPWDIQFYDKAILAYGESIKDADTKQDTSSSTEYKTRLSEIAQEVERRTAQLADLPPEQQQGRSFSLSEPAQEALQTLLASN